MYRLFLIFISASFMLSACEFAGGNAKLQDIDSASEARALVPVGSSMTRVREIMGNPSSTSTFGSETTWVYSASKLSENGNLGLGILISTVGRSIGGAGGILVGETVGGGVANSGRTTTGKMMTVVFNSGNRVRRVDFSLTTR